MRRSHRFCWRCRTPLTSSVYRRVCSQWRGSSWLWPLLLLLGLWSVQSSPALAAPEVSATRTSDAPKVTTPARLPDAGSRDGESTPTGDDPQAEHTAAAQARFDAAMRQLAEGHAAEAAAALSLLAHERPADELAPEALFEAAQLYDEQLENPTEAARLYRSLTEHYPQSRLLRRAENRLQRLTSGLRTGSAALTEFLSLQQKTEEDSPARLTRLQALLASHPDFALADQALYLLGRAQLRAGQSATQTFTTLQTRFPRSEWSAHAHKAQADALLARRHFAEARAHYEALKSHSGAGSLWPEIAQEGLQHCAQEQTRTRWSIAAGLLLLATLLVQLLRARRHLWPLPIELYYYLPVACFFALVAALVQGGAMSQPVLLLAVGGALINWAAAVSLRVSSPPASTRRRLLMLVFLVLWRITAVLALGYLVLHTQGLLDVVVETVENGPEE